MPRLLLLLALLGIGLQCLSFEKRPNRAVSVPCNAENCYTITVYHNLGMTHQGGCDYNNACKRISRQTKITPKQLARDFGINLPAGANSGSVGWMCCNGNDCNPKRAVPADKSSARLLLIW